MSLNYGRIFGVLKAMLRDADSYRNDDARSRKLANDALAKARSHKGSVRRVWNDLNSLVRLLQAWAGGRYRSVPWRSISLAIAALLYFVSPLDGIPDFIPFLGYVDDVFIITWIMRAIQKDLEKFRAWESTAA